MRTSGTLVALALAAALFAAQKHTATSSREQALLRAHALDALGRKLFFDPSLSASGKQSCASCHDPKFAYGPPNALAVQPGGIRAVPSLRYLQAIPQFTEHYFGSDDDNDESIDNGPTGGLTWDGRVDRLRDQARVPLLSSREMANSSEAAVVAAAEKAPYAEDLKKLTDKSPFDTILEALEAWQQDGEQFYPYTSKYDAFLAGKATLTDPETRGLRLFTDPQKGNCAQCHIATRGPNGTPPQFTDYGYAALGLPRNREIPANRNPQWYDLGLCGPERKDLRNKFEYCGSFITPTLRNVATRRTFFHNGVFHTLREAVAFYNKRDKTPPDLPARYRGNITTDRVKLSEAEIDDIVAFLGTLTDGFGTDPKAAQ
jgi:cytochrome c peroxidase